MNLRVTDPRFLLPRPPTHIGLVGPRAEQWDRFLPQLGALRTEQRNAEVMIADASHFDGESLAASAALVLGRGGYSLLKKRFPVVRRFIAAPDVNAPHLIVPADRPRVLDYAIRQWTSTPGFWRKRRDDLARQSSRLGLFPDLERSITLGLSRDGSPFVLSAAEKFGIPTNADWFLTLGLGDIFTRAAFHVFRPGSDRPEWIVKFSRTPRHEDRFDREEQGLALAAGAGSSVASHAPRMLGRYEAAGLPASVETAAVGRRMTYLLQTRGTRQAKLQQIEQIAAWLVDMSVDTAAPGPALAEERTRLERDVLPHWSGAGLPADLVAQIPDVPAVLQHNDLGCWNIVVGEQTFVVVDWESSQRYGLPLWDLVYFLVDALVHLDGEWDNERLDLHIVRLLRGETQSSAVLFRFVQDAIARLDVPDDAVGKIVTLAWLHHGRNEALRRAAARDLDDPTPVEPTYAERAIALWLEDPALGLDWMPWRR